MSASTITFLGVPEWSGQGPGPMVDGNAIFIGTGAVIALATHPAQAGIVYAATSGGGLRRTWTLKSALPLRLGSRSPTSTPRPRWARSP